MNRNIALLSLIGLFFRFDPAYSIFGAADVPLQEYYEFGRHQTGVASVQTKKKHQGTVKTSLGTANLIDVEDIGIPSLKGLLGALKGRVLITAAHVIHGSLLSKGAFVRFIDENNESQKMGIEDFFTPYNFRDKNTDIGIILLKQSVDTSKFKPLKLNLSTENKSFSRKLVNIFGCTPIFGKVNSNVVMRESTDTLLRRGMTTVADYTSDRSELISNFYTSKGMVSIVRYSTLDFTESDREKKHKVEEKLKRFDDLINDVQSDADKLTLTIEKNKLFQKQLELKKIEVRKHLSWTFFDNGNNIQEHLDILEDTEDLDKLTLISEWEKFINDGKYGNKSLDFGKYQVKFYGLLPRLSGHVYHGDSGGAWVIDDEIVAVSKQVVHKNWDNLKEEKVETLTPSLGISEYFTQCEAIISQPQSMEPNDQNSFGYGATSIWSSREWIESTLVKINAELDNSLPSSSMLSSSSSS